MQTMTDEYTAALQRIAAQDREIRDLNTELVDLGIRYDELKAKSKDVVDKWEFVG